MATYNKTADTIAGFSVRVDPALLDTVLGDDVTADTVEGVLWWQTYCDDTVDVLPYTVTTNDATAKV